MQVYFFFICLLLAHSVYSGVYSDIPPEDRAIVDQPDSHQLTVLHANNHQKITELLPHIDKVKSITDYICLDVEYTKGLWNDHGCRGKCAACGLALGMPVLAGSMMACGGLCGNVIYSCFCASCCGCQPTYAQCAASCGGTSFGIVSLWTCLTLCRRTINHSNAYQAYQTELHKCRVCLEEKEEIGLHRCSPDKDLAQASSICHPCFNKLEKKECLICKTMIDFPQD